MLNITKEELEKPRKASEIKPWVDKKYEELICTNEGKHALRYCKLLAKKLIEEAIPLGIFCKHYFHNSNHVTIQHIISSKNYDAIINDQRENKTTLEFLEITQAHEGEDAHLRKLKLEVEISVSAVGKVTKQGTKKTGITVEVEHVALGDSVIRNKELQRIYNAAERKSKNEYLKNTGLIIMFNDTISFRDSSNIEELKEYMQENVLSLLSNFSKVFIVGNSANIFLEFG